MKDFRNVFKQLANEKKLTSSDMYAYSILRAYNIKSEITYQDKVRAAAEMTRECFSPITNWNRLYCSNMGDPYYALTRKAATDFYLSNSKLICQSLESIEELKEIQVFSHDVLKAFEGAVKAKEEEDYMFVVVRTNLTKSQQAVQAIHASVALANYIQHENNTMVSGCNLVLCGVNGVPELNCLMDKVSAKGYSVMPYYEPDLHTSLTAVAIEPLSFIEKEFLKDLKLLKL